MSSAAASVVRIPAERLDETVDVFADAFAGYPVMRFTVGDEGDIAARERRLIRLFVERRVHRGGPMYAVATPGYAETNREKSTGMNIAGAVLLTLPDEPPADAGVAEISAAAWNELGDDARLRYDAYAEAGAGFFTAFGPHLHLNMIGVRRAHKGQGVGRVLLDKVRALAEANPSWSGVSLTTENPRNVDMYRHFGYDVVGHAQVGLFNSGQGPAMLETWGLFLRIG